MSGSVGKEDIYMNSDFNQLAEDLIAERRLVEARTMLEKAISQMPAGWKPSRDDGKALSIAFWYEEEFLAWVQQYGRRLNKTTLWIRESYSKAWYLLAAVAVEEKRLTDALFCIDSGLELEPDHPELLSEKGYILGVLKRHAEALECYIWAVSAREWSPAAYMARALRGQGVQLIDLDRLDEAETALKESLEYEPGNRGARNELEYIEELRGNPVKQRLPWFVEAFVNPPSDPTDGSPPCLGGGPSTGSRSKGRWFGKLPADTQRLHAARLGRLRGRV
jgi:tetratricopeptide (TPR) repeat protein